MKRIAFFLVSIYCLSACNNEMIGPDNLTDEKNSQIELIMPDVEDVHLYSTASFNENYIDSLWVIVFDGASSTANKKWVEKIKGSDIIRNGYASQLLPQLKHIPLIDWRIVCIANVDATTTDTTNVTPTTINNYFRLNKQDFYDGLHLPMYGEFIWGDFIYQPSKSGYSCEMVRAVAKIHVQMGTSVPDVTGNFTAENVRFRVHNGGGEGRIQPAATATTGGYAFTHTPNLYQLLQFTGATERNTTPYIYEFPSSSYISTGSVTPQLIATTNADTTFHAQRLHLILEKNNYLQGYDPTYYRLDFYNPVTKKYLDAKRNHHYIFTINKVRSEGYLSIAEAKANPGSNIEYTILITDGAKQVVSNGQYAIVASLDSIIPGMGMAYTKNMGTVRCQLPPEMANMNSISNNSISLEVTSVYPSGILNPITLASPSPAILTVANQTVSISVNASVLLLDGTIIFKLGNITLRLPIRLRTAS